MTSIPVNNPPCLSLAAILMFGSDEAIQKAAPAYAFDCLLRRENVDRYDDRLQIRTNLIEAYDQMMAFVEKHLNDPFYLEGDQRISLRDKIFREAVSNIIAHREYLHGTPGRLIIYSDKIILSNPCMPHHIGIITPENLEPFARNPGICQFLIQLGRFERIGSGVTNINRYLPLYAKNAKPVFEEKEHGFRLTIPLVEEGRSPTEVQVVFSILQACQKQECSSAEIAKRLGHKTLSGNLRKACLFLEKEAC